MGAPVRMPDPGFQRRHLSRMEPVERVLSDTRLKRVEGGNEICHKAREIVIALFYRIPRSGQRLLFQPRGQQGRLPETWRRGDKRERALEALVQPFDQPRTSDQVWMRRWDV